MLVILFSLNFVLSAAPARLEYVGNNGTMDFIKIENIGSDQFNPNKFSNWVKDAINGYDNIPLIDGKNIYAPTIVFNENITPTNPYRWNIYFGGWYLEDSFNDEIYRIGTNDFIEFSPVTSAITRGELSHINNCFAMKVGDYWKMYLTTLYVDDPTPGVPEVNRTALAYSADGVNWNPSNFGVNQNLVVMDNYDQWGLYRSGTADINGSNPVYYDENTGTYYLYYVDFENRNPDYSLKLLYGTSNDGITFNFQGEYSPHNMVANDIKKFNYNNENYYLMAYHANVEELWYSLSQDLTTFPDRGTIATIADRSNTAIGYVSDGDRLYGALYGSSPKIDGNVDLTKNDIFALWLQKKVIIRDNSGSTISSEQLGLGPDNCRLNLGTDEQEGKICIYGEDGETLIFKSENLSLNPGDIYRFVAGTNEQPNGYIDSATENNITGWAYDPDFSSEEISLHVYIDGAAGIGTLVETSLRTDFLRQDVNDYFGISGNHGFNWSIPDNLKSGIRDFHLYAIDLNGEEHLTFPKQTVTEIKFSIPKKDIVNITIYDIKGEVVKTVLNRQLERGDHTIQFQAEGLNSGVYFYRLQTKEKTIAKKMILTK